MFEGLKKFFREIQASDETRKKRWLVILSAILMILIVSSWLLYLNRTLGNINTAQTGDNSRQAQTAKTSPWQIFVTGLKTIAGQIKNLITATRKISIENNFSNPTSTPK